MSRPPSPDSPNSPFDDPGTVQPIVIVTGEAQQNQIDRARDAGADVVLVKPILPNNSRKPSVTFYNALPTGSVRGSVRVPRWWRNPTAQPS